MNPSRSALIVTHQWPPVGGSGVQRAVKLAKYLSRAGHCVHVLTAAHPRYALMDASLAADVPEQVTVHRVAGWDPASFAGRIANVGRRLAPGMADWTGLEDRAYWRASRLTCRLGTVEHERGWVKAAVRAAREIIQEHSIDAVITTSPPHSVQHVGAELARTTGIAWIADLRDPITGHFAYGPRSLREERYWHRIEDAIVRHASRIVTTCDDLACDWSLRFGREIARRMEVITNGFDVADRPHRLRGADDRFRLTYVGRFYRQQSIQPLLTAIRTLRARRPDAASIELMVAGAISTGDRSHIQPQDATFMRERGYLTHAAALTELADSDCLFLMTPPNAGGRLCIPGKTFEYLAFGGPVVALIHPETQVARLLRAGDGVESVLHGRQDDLVAAIERQFDAWKARKLLNVDIRRDVSAFDWRYLARRYAALIEAAANGDARESVSVANAASNEQQEAGA